MVLLRFVGLWSLGLLGFRLSLKVESRLNLLGLFVFLHHQKLCQSVVLFVVEVVG